MFDYTEAAKPVAAAIHNLTTLLKDSGTTAATFTPMAISYRLSGLALSGSSLAIEKSDGSYVISVWAEPVIWNRTMDSQA